MSGKLSLPPLPPLSRQALGEVGLIEEDVRDALEDCDDNLEKALRILRTGVTQSLNVQMDYYSSLPNYHPAWIVEVARTTVDSMIGLLPPLTFMPVEQFRGYLLRTAIDHWAQRLRATKKEAATVAPPRMEKPKSAAGADADGGSGLPVWSDRMDHSAVASDRRSGG